VPLLLHPVFGHKPTPSPDMHELSDVFSPSLPDHSLHATSSYEPSIAVLLSGKKAPGAPESVHSSKCIGMLYLLTGLETVWPQNSLSEVAVHKSLTLTTMLFPNGPVEEGVLGSEVGVILKQRPQAPPVPLLAPYASALTAAEYPFTFWPHAGDEQPLRPVNDAFPLAFCTQPLEDLPEVELVPVCLGCELAGVAPLPLPPLAGATEGEAPFPPCWPGL